MKQGDDLMTNWTRAQQKLWESLAAALSNSRSEGSQELVKAAHRGGMAAWEAAVNQSLKAQQVWLEQWFRNTQMANPDMARASEQLQEIMGSWVSTQSQLWDNWFDLLRNYSNTAQKGAEEAQALARSLPVPPPLAPPSSLPHHKHETPPANESLPPVPQEVVPSESVPSEPVPSNSPTTADDLKTIKGIGPALEKKLNDLGINSYRQIAQIGATEVERIEAVLRFPGRLYRDNWVGQAREAHRRKYGSDPS